MEKNIKHIMNIKIQTAIINYYGKKCTEYKEGCIACEVWKHWEKLKQNQRKD